MESIAADVIKGFNTFLADQQRQPGDCRLTLVQFDDRYEVLYTGRPLAEAPELTRETFVPRGTTALLDAIGRTIDATGDRLGALAEAERPDRVLVAIITDGLENASTDYSREQIFRHDLQATRRLPLVVSVSCREPGRGRGRGEGRHFGTTKPRFRRDAQGGARRVACHVGCCSGAPNRWPEPVLDQARQSLEEGALKPAQRTVTELERLGTAQSGSTWLVILASCGAVLAFLRARGVYGRRPPNE